MIEIRNLSFDVKGNKILKNININIGRCGLVCILGNSGCGKTTFLNCTSGLLNYQGSIKIDGCEIKELNDDDKSEYRLNNIGFVFQDFKLIEYQTVIDNIMMPFKTMNNCGSNQTIIGSDMLEMVGLKNYENRIVNSLSGGEKQRVAIARSFINRPKLILADEPTGSLDSKNSNEIMKVLKIISKKVLVICVTHNIDLANKYSDQIITMEDGEVKNIRENKEIEEPGNDLSIRQPNKSNKKPSLPISYVLKQTIQSFLTKKVRSIIGFLFMSFALLGIGLSVSFSSSISNSVKKSYSQLVETTEVNLQLNKKDTPKFRSFNKEDCFEIKSDFPNEIEEIGIVYQANFEEFFKDKNNLYFTVERNHYLLEGFSARNINEFVCEEENVNDIYPENASLKNSDEVFLGMTINQIRMMCFGLGIDQNIKSLSHYLENHTIPLVFEFANQDWDYWDEQMFILKGFCLTNEPYIINSNCLWNEKVFEEQMRFPTNEEYLYNEYPWILNKLTYITCNNLDSFLISIHNSEKYNNLIYDLCDKKYFPLKTLNTSTEEINKIVLYYGNDSYITPKELRFIQSSTDNIENETIFNAGSYVSYPHNLLNGFANKTYFSLDCTLLEETMEINSHIIIEDNEEEVLRRGIICSDYSKTFENPVKFCSKYDIFLKGHEPIDYSEIVISKGLMDSLKDVDLNDDFLYMATVTHEINDDYGIYSRQYTINKLKIVGVTNNAKPRIYHNPYWTIDFYITKVGISCFKLLPNVVSYTFIDENAKEETIEMLKIAFPQFEIINPLYDINKNVDDLCKTISLVVFAVSLVSLSISLILLSTVHYLNIQDIRKDIALMRCIGINKSDSKKYVYSFSIISVCISYLIACFELIIVSFVLSFSLANELSIGFELSLNPFAFMVMIAIAFLVVFLLSALFSKKVTNIEPLECLRS